MLEQKMARQSQSQHHLVGRSSRFTLVSVEPVSPTQCNTDMNQHLHCMKYELLLHKLSSLPLSTFLHMFVTD